MLFKKFSISDIGNFRKRNEDSYLELELELSGKNGLLMVVADGMGGHRAGDVASRTVTESVREYIKGTNNKAYSKLLCESLIDANRNVFRTSLSNPELYGMGSTCTALLMIDGNAYIAHAGDSRAYLIRDNQTKQLTSDQTVAEEMRVSGQITTEDARTSPQRNILTNAVGTKDTLDVEEYDPVDIRPGDCYVLCSDGLSEYIEDDELGNIIDNHDPEDACRLLVDIAKRRGGRDNITVQVVKVVNSNSGPTRNLLKKILNK